MVGDANSCHFIGTGMVDGSTVYPPLDGRNTTMSTTCYARMARGATSPPVGDEGSS